MRKEVPSPLVLAGREYITPYLDGLSNTLRALRMLPLSWLHLSTSKRLLIVTLSYGVGIIGLWFLFPRTHNGASMFLPIIGASWLFRYRGMLICMVLNGIAFQLAYLLLLRGMLPDYAFVEGGVTGFLSSLGLGFVICWLRTAVDRMQAARQRALTAEYARMQAIQAEQQVVFAYEQQRKINELKDQFLLHMSHELRTPLTTLGGFLELLQSNHDYQGIQQAHLLKAALASQEELVDIVNSVLDATTLIGDIPQAQPEVVSVPQLVQEVLAQCASEDVQRYTIRVKMPAQLEVRANSGFLRQILRNLLSNAFKYVPSQTEICIEATQADPASRVYLSVQDAGPGIPLDELPLLFEKCVRLKRDLAGPTRGIGLGLYICKQLVLAMGGHIWVESSGRPGEGCRFCLTLSPRVMSADTPNLSPLPLDERSQDKLL